MSLFLRDPTNEMVSTMRKSISMPKTLNEKVVAFLDISKERSDEFIDYLEANFADKDITTKRYRKASNSKPANQNIIQRIVKESDVAVVALADWGSCTSCSLHDLNNLDKLGIPGLVVATTEFKTAAASQAKSLGFEPNILWVKHPIQVMTQNELKQTAEKAFLPLLSKLVG